MHVWGWSSKVHKTVRRKWASCTIFFPFLECIALMFARVVNELKAVAALYQNLQAGSCFCPHCHSVRAHLHQIFLDLLAVSYCATSIVRACALIKTFEHCTGWIARWALRVWGIVPMLPELCNRAINVWYQCLRRMYDNSTWFGVGEFDGIQRINYK